MMKAHRGSTARLGQAYRDQVRTHADSCLGVTAAETDPAVVSRTLRRFLKIEDQRLKTAHYLGRAWCETSAARSFVLNIAVGHAFRHAAPVIQSNGIANGAQLSCALLAVGGDGRDGLAPYSDVDLPYPLKRA